MSNIYPINHFLSALAISIGFLLFYKLNFRKNVALGLIFFLMGLGIGMHEHLAQDEVTYPKDDYLRRIVYLEEYENTPKKDALCVFIFNNHDFCSKYKEAPQ